jgi:hypothetical protein
MRFNVGYLFANGAIERFTILGQTGYVGINTSSPNSLLNVSTGVPSGAGSLPSNVCSTMESTANNFMVFRNSQDNGSYTGILFQDNNIGGSIIYKNYTGSATQFGDYLHLAGYNGVCIAAAASASPGNSNDPTQNVPIASFCYNRNSTIGVASTVSVGIGQINPATTLDVNGTIRTSGNQGTNALILYLLATPFTQQVSYTGFVNTSLTFPSSSIPAAARAVLATVFTNASLLSGTTPDHQVYSIGAVAATNQAWEEGWGSNPSSYFGALNQSVIRVYQDGEQSGTAQLPMPGQRGIWHGTFCIPIAANGVCYYSNYGNSGSSGYIYFNVIGYYM